MAVEGSLGEVSLADICQLLAMGRKTGCLTITNRSSFGYIYFENGRVIYASVLNRPDRLGDLLVRNGVVSPGQLSDAMETQRKDPGRRLGRILVDEGLLTEEKLNEYITIQIEEAVYHLFTWEQGSFHFDPDEAPDEEGALLVSIPAESLLMEGARRVDEWSLIEKKIPSFDIVFSLQRDPLSAEDLELTDPQRKVIPLLDGQRTVEELVHESGMVEFDVGKALYGLLQAGFLQQTGRRSPQTQEVGDAEARQHVKLGRAFYRAGMLEDAEREFRLALEADGDFPGVRSRLGVVCLKTGRLEEALEHFDRMAPQEAGRFGPLMNRALVLERLERYPEALEELLKAEQLEPASRRMLLSLGIVQLKVGDAEAARSSFLRYRKVLEDEEPSALYYAYAALALAMGGRIGEALALGREGLTRHPESGPVLVNMGAILERHGEREAAESLYLRAVSEAKTPAQAHKNLGDMAYRRGDQAGARAHYEKAVEIDPTLGDDVYMKLGTIAYKEQDRDWARLLWQRALELNPRNEVARTNLEALSVAPGA